MEFSLRNLVMQFAGLLQQQLFPMLDSEVGPLGVKHRRLITTLGMLSIEAHVGTRNHRGRPAHDRVALLRAFLAKAVFNLPTTELLIQLLKSDAVLRGICGWQGAQEVPHKSAFSRAFRQFAETSLPQRIHDALIETTQRARLIGHISRDSTAIRAREKAVPNRTQPANRKVAKSKQGAKQKKPTASKKEERRIKRQLTMTVPEMLAELPRHCTTGTKTNADGRKETWRGYKLHLDVADGQIPITALLTSASLHDSQVAIPMAHMTARRVTSCYDLMDSAYDCREIRQTIQALGHVPIIERLHRHHGIIEFPRHEAIRFRERTAIERVNARLKDEFGGRFVRVRGNAKVMAHLMFGVLALTVDQVMRMAAT